METGAKHYSADNERGQSGVPDIVARGHGRSSFPEN